MMTALLTLLALGIAAMVAFGVIFVLFGVVFSLAFGVVGFLLFKVAPILLVGWIVLKVIERSRSPAGISAADRRWLDGE